MGEKALVVTDNVRGRWQRRIAKDARILTLGITPEYYRFNARGGAKLADENFLDVKDISDEVQRRVGEFYINFIFELPRRTRERPFFHDGKNLWWFLKISEKNTVGSKVVDRLFYIELIRRAVEKGGFKTIYLDVEDSFVSHAAASWPAQGVRRVYKNSSGGCKRLLSETVLSFLFGYLKNSFGVFLITAARSLALKAAGLAGAVPSKEKALFLYTHYPSWWDDPYGSDAKESFFGQLPGFIEKTRPLSYIASILSLSPLAVFLKRSSLARFFSEKKVVLAEELLTLREKSKILSLGYLWWALSVRRHFKTGPRLTFNGFDITELVCHEISRSLSQAELFKDILIEDAFRNFSMKYLPRALIYRIEFQPFEKALLRGLGRGCKTIAFQHSTFSRNRLSQFFAPGEAAFHLDSDNAEDAMPLPDVIFTAGIYFRDILIKEGFPGERVDICGPIRFWGLVSYLKNRTDKTEIRKRLGFSHSEKIFLVALNWLEKEGTLLAALVEAARGMGEGLHIIFRSRPYMNYDNVISEAMRRMGAGFRYSFLNTEFPLYDAIALSDGVIQVVNTVGYESMAIGRVPIVYENAHAYNINSPEELMGHTPIAHSSSELKDDILAVLESDKGLEGMKNGWPDVLRKVFYDLSDDPNERFIGLLKKHGALE